jgi:hypothetical protein
MKKLCVVIICFSIIISGCEKSNWQSSSLTTSMDITVQNCDFDGEIPDELSDWEVLADISNDWFSCNQGYILQYTKMSVDLDNNVWIYGPDHWNGPYDGMSDNPGCEEDSDSRVIIYNQTRRTVEHRNLNIDKDSYLFTASGWIQINNNRALISSIFIPGGINTKQGDRIHFIDLAMIEDNTLIPISVIGDQYRPVSDVVVFDNKIYAIINAQTNHDSGIKVFDLETYTLLNNFVPDNCEQPQRIEVNNDNIFLVCQNGGYFSLKQYDNDFSFVDSWQLLAAEIGDLPLEFDAQGNLWIGYSYIAHEESDYWEVEKLFPEKDLIYQISNEPHSRRIISLIPYKNGMFFNLDGAFYIATIEKKEWRKIIHNSGALPVAKGIDGKLYVFTGKYILASEP